MCQLSFVNVSEPQIRKALLGFLLTANTEHDHHDGVGMSYRITPSSKRKIPERYISTNLNPPYYNPDFFKKFLDEDFADGYPIIAHVRKATSSFYSKEDKDNDSLWLSHVHPFVDDKNELVLAHNGTLRFQSTERDNNAKEEFPEMIDSQIFLACLSEAYHAQPKESRSLPEALQTTMKLFYGKFAFLIEETSTKRFYIVRGKATLFKSNIYLGEEKIGFVVNTERKSLRSALGQLHLAFNMFSDLEIKFSPLEELEEETIYVLNDGSEELEVVDKIEQNTKEYNFPKAQRQPTTHKQLPARTGHPAPGASTLWSATQMSTSMEQVLEAGDKYIRKYLQGFGDISLLELDQIMNVFSGEGLVSLTPRKLREFAMMFANPTLEYIGAIGYSKTLFKRWRKIKKHAWATVDARGIYSQYPKLSFPFFFSSDDVLHSIELDYRQQRQSKEKKKAKGG